MQERFYSVDTNLSFFQGQDMIRSDNLLDMYPNPKSFLQLYNIVMGDVVWTFVAWDLKHKTLAIKTSVFVYTPPLTATNIEKKMPKISLLYHLQILYAMGTSHRLLGLGGVF